MTGRADPSFVDPSWVDEAVNWAGAYLHIPFCGRVCPYCDFAVVEGRDEVVRRYVDAMLAEIAVEPPWRTIDAVFVGGGTPSHVDPAMLDELVGGVRDRFGVSADAEITLEANPEDWTPARAKALIGAGFNRVSLGVQSLDPDVLSFLGRRHSPQNALEAVAVARRQGFTSVSVDLIMGSPGESLASWRQTVEVVAWLDVDHVSAYGLTVERGTPLGRAVAAGAPGPDPDEQADKYEYAQETFSGAGLVQYEVSNYARPGHECRYNLGTWAQGEYLAFGMGAHGHRDGERTWRVRRLEAYVDRIQGGESAIVGRERLTGDARERERLMVGVPRTAGVVPGDVGDAWLAGPEAQRFIEADIVVKRADRIVVTRPLMTDAVARSILAAGMV